MMTLHICNLNDVNLTELNLSKQAKVKGGVYTDAFFEPLNNSGAYRITNPNPTPRGGSWGINAGLSGHTHSPDLNYFVKGNVDYRW